MFKSHCDLEKYVKFRKILSAFTIVTIYLCNFENNPPTVSKDILLTMTLKMRSRSPNTKHHYKSVTIIYSGKSEEYQSSG